MKRVTLSTKIVGILIFFILILGVSILLFVKESTTSKLKAELQDKGLSIGRNLAANCVQFILVEDLISLQYLVNSVKELERDVDYVFILDAQKRVVVHTFEEGFPTELIEANNLRSGQPYRVQLLDTEKGFIRDIAIPIWGGRLGSVHLGFSEARIRAAVALTVHRLVAIISAILAIGICLTYFITKRSLIPLEEMTKAIQAIGRGDFHQKIKVKTKDEVGTLAQTFNEMAARLERANQELKSTQNRLIQAAKMATIGQFSAGIAHEVNNPLAGMLNCVRSLLMEPEIKGRNREYLELLLKGLLRIEEIIRQLLSFSGQQKSEPRLVDVNQLIRESLAFIEHRLFERQVVLGQDLANSLPPIFADPHQLQQVFMNVLNNALDALPEGGRLYIETVCKDAEESGNKKLIQIKFIDSGYGIKEEDLDRVFDPFYTTKEVGEGVGLGLAISYHIIQNYQGTIGIKSKEGEGTTLTITLPVFSEMRG